MAYLEISKGKSAQLGGELEVAVESGKVVRMEKYSAHTGRNLALPASSSPCWALVPPNTVPYFLHSGYMFGIFLCVVLHFRCWK